MAKWNDQEHASITVKPDRRRWTRWFSRHKVYSDLNPAALDAAINEAERRHGERIRPPAISAAIKEYLRVNGR